MAISEATATIASGGMSLGGSLIAGILNYYAQQDANKKNYAIYQQQRADQKAADKEQAKQAKAVLALNTRAQAFSEAESDKNRAEGLEQKGYGRMMGAYERGASLLTQALQINQAKATPFQKYA